MTDPLVALLRRHSSGVTTDDWGEWHMYRDLERLAGVIREHLEETATTGALQ